MTNKEKEIRTWIKNKIATSDKWAVRALIIVAGHQTKEEQTIGLSRGRDASGFNLYDGERMNYFAARYEHHRTLSDKAMVVVKEEMQKYWKQVLQNMGEEIVWKLMEPTRRKRSIQLELKFK